MKFIVVLLFFISFNFSFSQNIYINQIINDIQLDSLIDFVENISGEKGVVVNGNLDTIYSRHKSKPGNELAFKYIIQEFERFELMSDSMVFSATGKNALAIQPGSVYPNQYYIICAHYDDMPNLPIAPAADDDGSGVGAVLEAARVLSNYEFEYTIIYAIWDEEEQGLVGSAAYALAAQNNNDSLMGVLNVDAIAWDGDNDSAAMIHVRPIGTSLQLTDTIQSINTTYNLGLELAITNPGATYSDHASFWNRNFGAVLIIEDWTFDPNPHYHTDTDLIAYFNLPYYERMAKLSIASLASLAVPTNYLNMEESDFAKHDLKIYPNPTQNYFYIKSDEIIRNICLYNSNGALITKYNNYNDDLIRFEFSNHESGIYFLKIETEHNIYTRKIIKRD